MAAATGLYQETLLELVSSPSSRNQPKRDEGALNPQHWVLPLVLGQLNLMFNILKKFYCYTV